MSDNVNSPSAQMGGTVAVQAPSTGPEEFDRGWLKVIQQTPSALAVIALGGLTRLGERPAQLDHLARVLDLPVTRQRRWYERTPPPASRTG